MSTTSTIASVLAALDGHSVSEDEPEVVRRVADVVAQLAVATAQATRLRVEAAVADNERRIVTAERDHLKRREADIIEATDPADGGQYRADIVGAIQRQRRERDEALAQRDAWRTWARARAAYDASSCKSAAEINRAAATFDDAENALRRLDPEGSQ